MIFFSILIAYTSSQRSPFPGLLFVIISAVVAVVWVYLGANMVIDFLTFISHITKFSKIFLSLTLLALGNSLGDFFVNSSIAKKGYGIMALTGVFSGQLLNLLIGFSLNSIVSLMSSGWDQAFGGVSFFVNKSGSLIMFMICYSFIRQITLFGQGILQQTALGMGTSVIALSVYVVFFVVFLVIELSSNG